MPTRRMFCASGGSPTLGARFWGDWAKAVETSSGVSASASTRCMASSTFCWRDSIRALVRAEATKADNRASDFRLLKTPSRVHVATVDRDHLAGDEIAVGGGEKD